MWSKAFRVKFKRLWNPSRFLLWACPGEGIATGCGRLVRVVCIQLQVVRSGTQTSLWCTQVSDLPYWSIVECKPSKMFEPCTLYVIPASFHWTRKVQWGWVGFACKADPGFLADSGAVTPLQARWNILGSKNWRVEQTRFTDKYGCEIVSRFQI